jgi:hypothetical protein
MTQLGFKTTGDDCSHRDNWGIDLIAGYIVRTCWSCGRSEFLVKLQDGGLAWERIREEGETSEAVQPVQTGETEGSVRKKPKSRGRSRSSVQDVPPPLQLDAPAEEIEGTVG